jgi:hypothetical protein
VNDELEVMWKETVVTGLLFRNLPGGTEENQGKTLVELVGLWVEI